VLGSKQSAEASGTSAASALAQGGAKKPVLRLVLADALPHNSYDGNAFRNSVHFDDATRTLAVRLARFREGSAGDLMVFLVHAFAHVMAGGAMHPDGNAVFQGHFHHSLRQCGKLISALSRNSQDFSAKEHDTDAAATAGGKGGDAGGAGSGAGAGAGAGASAGAGAGGASKNAAGGADPGGDSPALKTSLQEAERLIQKQQQQRPPGAPRPPPPIKGALGRKHELAEELDGAEAAYLQVRGWVVLCAFD
jgi:hypothetical protein